MHKCTRCRGDIEGSMIGDGDGTLFAHPSCYYLAKHDEVLSSLERAQKAIVRYMVAQGPHMPDSWHEFLTKECGLLIDEGSPYGHPMVPKRASQAPVEYVDGRCVKCGGLGPGHTCPVVRAV